MFLIALMQAQIDGNVVHATFTLSLPKKVSPPPKPVAAASKRDASRTDNVSADVEKDGPKRPREPSPRRKPLPSPRRRSPGPRRGGSPRRLPDSSPRRRPESPVRRRLESPYRRVDTPPRRRPASPPRGRSPSSPPRRHRSPPRPSPRRMRGSPIRRRSPLPPRRRLFHLVLLLDELAVLQEGHHCADAVAPLFVGQFVLIQDLSRLGEAEYQLQDAGGHHPTLDHLVHGGYPEGYQGVVVLEVPFKEVEDEGLAMRMWPLRGRSSSNSSSSSSPPRKP
ncbi:hypothetical protein Pint_05005 [Pistacia integerrima]|uniref:Uncharacterized protein n=1 Tax=Pistacia integerrima TaxID=434235 RepID=A0ACC0Z6B4_9ROSI|nr:hypothetical protein Pint_05005 [Pistacia integerrima]